MFCTHIKWKWFTKVYKWFSNFYRWYHFIVKNHVWCELKSTTSIFLVHLSTRIIRAAQLHHFVNTFNSSWQSSSVLVAIALSSANWNQCLGISMLEKVYPIHLTRSWSTVFIRVLTTKLNNSRLKQSPCKTPLPTINGSFLYWSVAIVIIIIIIIIVIIITIIIVDKKKDVKNKQKYLQNKFYRNST